jgi:zinc protease
VTVSGAASRADRPVVGTRIRLRETTLTNGIRVVVHENRSAPMVVLRLGLRASTSHDSPEVAGLASLVASGLNRGTTSRSFAEINAMVDAAGMAVGASAGRHQTTIGARCLTEDLALAVDLLADLTRNPTFPDDEIQLLKGQAQNGLRQAENDTGAVAHRNFRERCYPEGHPYRLRPQGYLPTLESIGAAQLRAAHADSFGVEGAVIVASGDIAFEYFIEMLEHSLGSWVHLGPPPVVIEAVPLPAASRYDATIDGKTQSDLVVGAPCIARSHPDFQAARLANLIFGRLGMMGRLGESVREAMGLAYGISSDLDAGPGAGPWAIRAGVNPTNVEAALDGIRSEIVRLHREGVTDDEFERARRFSTGSVALQLESNDGIASTISDMLLHDLGLDFIDRYPEIIGSVTIEDVNRAARDHFPKFENLVVSVCGPPPSP